jgi:feruloyl esterase
MKRRMGSVLCIALFASFVLVSIPAAAQQSCESLAALKIPNVTFTAATSINPPPAWEAPKTAGPFGTPGGLKVSVSFCRVEGYSQPASDSHIGFEVWLPPAASWNGKLLALGNPGFIGSIVHGGLAGAMQRGYVAASTDTGHVDPGYGWAVGHPEKLKDWGYRAVHETAVAAKQLIQGFYGTPVKFAYWNSCHNGGNQGLNEVQRYPEDFDGVVAGDPAYYVTRLQAGSEYISWVALKDGVKAPGYIPPSKYPVIHRAVLDACDAKDGVADGILEDPLRCRFDPKSIQCNGPDAASCLTDAQVETARKIYAGAKFNDGTQVYSGFEPGSELGWGMMAAGPEPINISTSFFSEMVFENPKWDFRTFDVDRDTRLAESRLGTAIDAFEPKLKPFKDRGGKLILYQAWDETIIPPRTLIDYYGNIENAMGGSRQTQDFARLFVVPGSSGCPGFSDPKAFDALDAVEKWREKNIPPDKIIFSLSDRGKYYKSLPVCPYPQIPVYKGSGDINEAASFACEAPRK